MTVHIQLPNGSAYPHPGLTNLLDVQVETGTDTVAVRAQVPNPEGLLIPGGVVGVTVERGAPRSALVVPQSSNTPRCRARASFSCVLLTARHIRKEFSRQNRTPARYATTASGSLCEISGSVVPRRLLCPVCGDVFDEVS